MRNIIYIIGTGNRDECFAAGANIALCLAKNCKGKLPVAFLNLNSNSNTELEVLFNIKPEYSLENLLLNPDISLTKHSSGVELLGFSRDKYYDKEELNSLNRCIAALSDNYSYTVIVSSQPESQEILNISTLSAVTLLLLSPDLLSVRSVKTILSILESGHFSTETLKPVLIECDIDNAISASEIGKFINLQIFSRLPFTRDYTLKSINTGIPEFLSDNSSHFSNAINTLTRQITDILTALPQSYAMANTEPHIEKNERLSSIRNDVHSRLIKEIDLKAMDFKNASNLEKHRVAAGRIIENLIANVSENDIPRTSRPVFIQELLNDVFGLGCLEQFLNDPAVTEIMVNGHKSIFVEIQGKIQRAESEFSSQDQLRTVIERIVSPVGRRIDESSPIVDARLADGSRVNAVIHPISLAGPVLTIRKFSKKKLTVNDLINFGALTQEMADFIKTCVLLRKNIIVSGGTGSGKTTLLNVISSFIPADERIITIEDSAELKLPQEHVVRLEARPQSIEGAGEIPIRKLVINALRMRPDRIVVGECRAGEALDMLQAMNTGHDGSLTTLHANSPKDAISRISTMVMMAGMELPDRSIKEQIASAVNIIIQLSRLADGSRKVIEIAETAGMKNDSIELIPIFRYEQTGISKGKVIGCFKPVGNIPSFFGDLNAHGLELDKTIFTAQRTR